MSKVHPYFKKTIKVILWVILSFVLLFILIAVLIQIPSIQTKVVHYATSFISNKTHTRVEINRVSISFPKTVVVEGLYLEDLNKDTLIYAGSAKVNMALYDLLKSKIAISSFDLEDATVKLHSALTDPLFNYNFLLTAFADTTIQVKSGTLSVSKWSFSLDQVSLKNVRFTYHDEYAGMNVFAVVKKSEFSVDEIDPGKSGYQFDELLVDGLSANVRMIESGNTPDNHSKSVLPRIGAKKIQLNNSRISFADSVGCQSVISVINECKLEDASIDLQTQLLASESVYLSESEIYYHTFSPELSSKVIVTTSGSNWKVSMNRIELVDNTMIYKSGNKPEVQGVFDTDNLTYSHLSLDATDFYYSSDLSKASITKFSATDQNNFAINSFETDFSMDEHSITANKLKATAANSSIDADFNIQYSSLAAFMDSMEFSNLKLDLRNVRFKNSDLLYFNPDLIEQSFFINSANVTTASGIISGTINNLNGKNLVIHAGDRTILKTDFSIKGLPEYKTALYDFPNLSIVSGRKDIKMMADTLIPESIEIPENISLRVVFKGKMKSFESTMNVSSSFGAANLIASIDPAENFSSKVSMSNLNLGRLLKDTVLYGPVTLTAEANGKGLDMKTMQAKIKADATEIYLNKYTYHK
ncbi:MAG: hypothetical protein Q8N05_21965, partial [Bacteroidota bacterium]|nr:hypothetical protein [Bacteroidota bacterium]